MEHEKNKQQYLSEETNKRNTYLPNQSIGPLTRAVEQTRKPKVSPSLTKVFH